MRFFWTEGQLQLQLPQQTQRTMSSKQWTIEDMVDMSGKIVLVTGGNGGKCRATLCLQRCVLTSPRLGIGYYSCKVGDD
jgi:hypothetical protein